MTKITDDTRREDYTAAASQTIFPYTFEIIDELDLTVYVDGAQQTLNTDYSVSGVGVEGGGNVTFFIAMAGGEAVLINGDKPIEKQSEFDTGTAVLLADELNSQFSAIVMMMQQLERDISRCVRSDLHTVSPLMQLGNAAARAGKYLYFSDPAGDVELAEITASTTVLSRSVIATFLNPATTAEDDSGVTVLNFHEPVYSPLRYLSNATPGTTVMDAGFDDARDAIRQAGAGVMLIPAQDYRKDAVLTLDTVNLVTAYILRGEGSNSAGSVLHNTVNDVVAIYVDGDIADQVAVRLDRCVLKHFRIEHQAATKYAIVAEEAPYLFIENVVIRCDSGGTPTGFGGIFLGSTTVIPDSDNFLSRLLNLDVRDYTDYGIRINSKGHTFELVNCKVGGDAAGGVAGYFNTEGVNVIGGQWGNAASGGSKGLYWYNLGAGDIEGGSARNLKMEGCLAEQYAIDIDGATNAWIGIDINNVGGNLIGNPGTLVRFGRAKWCTYRNPAIRNPDGAEQGTHDGGDGAATLSDSTQSMTVNEYVDQMVHNVTDGSRGKITANDATTVTAVLAGGTDNDWDDGDKYIIGGALAEWGENSIGCVVECSYNAALAPIIVHSSATRAVKRVTGEVARSQVQNITVAPNLQTEIAGGVDDLPADFKAAHNGVAWNNQLITLMDDIATSFLPPFDRGYLQLYSNGGLTFWGEVYFDTTAPDSVLKYTPGDLEVTTGALGDGGGTDVKVTVSPHTDGLLYLSNRSGGTLKFTALLRENAWQ